MRFYGCAVCSTSYQVGGVDPGEMESLLSVLESEGGPRCPTPLCRGRLRRTTGHLQGFESKEIPFTTFYRSVHGFGSPDGEAATLEKFSRLLKTKRVVEIHAQPIGQPERVILKRLVLDDGTRLHFDASSRGACCYYIESPGPSCMEVVEDEIHDDDADRAREVSDQDREEAGRNSETDHPDGAAAGDDGTAQAPTPKRSRSRSLSSVPNAGGVSNSGRGRRKSDNRKKVRV